MEGVEQSQCAPGGSGVAGHDGITRRARTTRVVAAGALALAAGLGLRLGMLRWLFDVSSNSLGDTAVYGGIAKNLLLHGQYALTAGNGEIYPTLQRLPGYPLFLAVCFRLFGMENYFAVCLVQIALELAGCLLVADFARRAVRALAPTDGAFAWRAGWATLWLAALCPFTASYAAFPLAEAPTLFVLALAMWAMARFCEHPAGGGRGWTNGLLFTFAVTWAALLRPDGALAALAFAPVMVMASRAPSYSQPFAGRVGREKSRLARMAVICAIIALAPFAVWTARNWRVFHVLEPLAPRPANDPGEDAHPGWERWVKTWCLDFTSTYDIYWNVPGGPLDLGRLPARAFDSPRQRAETAALFGEYTRGRDELTPAIDDGFARLARERVAAHPLRYYVGLPLGRVADMWLRPRIENLPIDLDWWVASHHYAETRFSWFYAALNALYLALAVIGLWVWPRFDAPATKTCPWEPRVWKALLAYILLRSALLLTVEAPETRYTLECFPMLFALGGVAIAAGWGRIAAVARQL